MKKKVVTLMLSLMLVLSLAACGGNSEDEKKADSSSSEETKADEPEKDADSKEDADSQEDADSKKEEDADSQEAGDTNGGWDEFLSHLTIIEPTDAVIGVEWGMSGGMVDGVELEQEDLDANLEQYGGKLDIVFEDGENVSIIQGGGTRKGIYGVLEDDKRLFLLTFDNDGSKLEYAGLFANVDDTEVLMLFPDDTAKNAIYFTKN